MAGERVTIENLTEYNNTLLKDANILKRSTAYTVNNVVNKGQVVLKCTTAGTTGSSTLNLSSASVGSILTDGTVTWEVISVEGYGSGSGNGLQDWEPNHSYKENDTFVSEHQIYKALVGFTSGSTFEEIEILEDYTPVDWQPNTTYVTDDIFIESGTLYKVLTNFTSGSTFSVTSDIELYNEKEYQEGTDITTGEIFTYSGDYYEALYDFTCGEEFSKTAFEEYVPKSLTDEDVEEVINSYTPEFSGGAGGENYSTEEQRIGTWIDGKPLYRKVLTDLNITLQWNATYFAYKADLSFNVNDIDTLINAVGYGTNFCMPVTLSINKSTNKFDIQGVDVFTINKLVLQYTKTTD